MNDFMKVIQHVLIKHPKTKKVLILQYSDGSGQFAYGKWALPGGHLKLGETPMEGLKREVTEETGVLINDIRPVIPHIMLFPDGVQRYGIIFTATCSEQVITLSKEHLAYRWVGLAECEGYTYVNSTFREVVKNYLKGIQT